jgi:hypothetical protein
MTRDDVAEQVLDASFEQDMAERSWDMASTAEASTCAGWDTGCIVDIAGHRDSVGACQAAGRDGRAVGCSASRSGGGLGTWDLQAGASEEHGCRSYSSWPKRQLARKTVM